MRIGTILIIVITIILCAYLLWDTIVAWVSGAINNSTETVPDFRIEYAIEITLALSITFAIWFVVHLKRKKKRK